MARLHRPIPLDASSCSWTEHDRLLEVAGSPDGRWIVASGFADGALTVWRAPP